MVIAIELEQVREAIGYATMALYPDFPPSDTIPLTVKEIVEEIFNNRIDNAIQPKFLNNSFYDELVCNLIDGSISCFLDRYPSATIRRVELLDEIGHCYIYS